MLRRVPCLFQELPKWGGRSALLVRGRLPVAPFACEPIASATNKHINRKNSSEVFPEVVPETLAYALWPLGPRLCYVRVLLWASNFGGSCCGRLCASSRGRWLSSRAFGNVRAGAFLGKPVPKHFDCQDRFRRRLPTYSGPLRAEAALGKPVRNLF